MNNEMNEMTTDQRVSHTPMFGILDSDLGLGYNSTHLDDFGVTHASQDEVDCEHEIIGTTIEDDYYDEDDEETTDMKQLSPAFREIFNEYPEDGFSVFIGSDCRADGEMGPFDGSIDQVSVYNKVLTDDQIEQNFKAEGNETAVNVRSKLATTWGSLKSK